MFFILIALIFLVIFFALPDSNDNKSNQQQRRNTAYQRNTQNRTTTRNTSQNFSTRLQSLKDSEDLKLDASEQQKELTNKTRDYHSKKFQSSNFTLSTSWADNLEELLETTGVVYSNAQLNSRQMLLSKRFQYYIRLHYRSLTAANLCHEKIKELYEARNQVNSILQRLCDKNDPLRTDKKTFTQLTSIQKYLNSMIHFLSTRRDNLNQQTALLRDKIKVECGEKGLQWYQQLQARKAAY